MRSQTSGRSYNFRLSWKVTDLVYLCTSGLRTGCFSMLTLAHAWYYHRGVMRDPRRCVLWAICLIGGGLVLSNLVSLGLLSALKGQLVLSSWLWTLARSLLVLSWLCMGAGIVLLVRGVTSRARK